LLGNLEKDIMAWTLAMQIQGHPLFRVKILVKGNEMCLVIQAGGRRISPRFDKTFSRD
jgi:hypothetical protein